MPDGLLQWYDQRQREGRVVRGSREYPVRAGDMEPRARVPGARVHFDVARDDGVDRAVRVRIREGTRTSRRQRRFGDMIGSRRPDSRGPAPFARPHPELARRPATDPKTVVKQWGRQLAAAEVDAAVLLYAPDAVVHTGNEDVRGRRVRGWLSASGLSGHIGHVDVVGATAGPAADEYIRARWAGPGGASVTSWFRIAHGEVAEQWVGGATPPDVGEPPGPGRGMAGGMTRPAGGTAPPEATVRAEAGGRTGAPRPDRTGPAGPEGAVDTSQGPAFATTRPTIQLVAHGAAAEAAAEAATAKVTRLLGDIAEPVLHVRLSLFSAPSPVVERPATAKATLDIDGLLVRAHAVAHTVVDAVNLLERRLEKRLHHRTERIRALHRLAPTTGPGEWRHGQLPSERTDHFDRPAEDRQVVRHKAYALDASTIDEAAFDMDMLAYDFHLFRELATGDDAVLHRGGDGTYGLQRLHASSLPAEAATVRVVLDPEPASTQALTDAIEWLDVSGAPFVFFAEAETGRARVAYHRYDGHYGLLTPMDEPAPATEPATARRRLRAELDRLEGVRATLLAEHLDEEPETDNLSEVTSVDQHYADIGTETYEREKDLSLLEDVRREVAQVRHALTRLGQGTYGRCEACGREIPDERLAAQPAARFCLEHQAATEVIHGIDR